MPSSLGRLVTESLKEDSERLISEFELDIGKAPKLHDKINKYLNKPFKIALETNIYL